MNQLMFLLDEFYIWDLWCRYLYVYIIYTYIYTYIDTYLG